MSKLDSFNMRRAHSSRLPGLFLLLVWPYLSGFVLLSGPSAARLDLSLEKPVVTFAWDGKTPELEKKDEYKGGIYADTPDEEVMETLLEQAMKIWTDVPGSFVQLKLEKNADAKIDAEDNIHSISSNGSANATSAAFAAPQVSDDGKTIRDCDITVSDRKTTVKELLYTLTHELGHCLGLGHNHSDYHSIMGYSRDLHDPRLGADDMAGVIYLYPEDGKSSVVSSGAISCGTIGVGAINKARALEIFLLLLPVLLGMVAWRRQPFREV